MLVSKAKRLGTSLAQGSEAVPSPQLDRVGQSPGGRGFARGGDLFYASLQHVQCLFQLLVGYDQRGQKTEAVARNTRGQDQHPALGGELQYLPNLALGGLLGVPVLDELHSNHRPQAPDLPDLLPGPRQPPPPPPRPRSGEPPPRETWPG